MSATGTINVIYTAEAHAKGGRDGSVKSSDGNIDMLIKPPRELGGPDVQATNPEQLFAAGYGACFLSAVSLLARLQKISAKEFTVDCKVDLGAQEDGSFDIAAHLDTHLPGIERDRAHALVRSAHKRCPYSRATRGNIEVEILVAGEALDEEAAERGSAAARAEREAAKAAESA
ncbi:MAG: lipoyl-dependent peroxiredoxin [Solirubrobacteraceae bacterium]|jgi:Ohr subfamily peroxiredoxin|nr:lipoyl-dependent peroxiredoxin [Solirubrobacteraceae bacterium]